ncbi:RagB/SusD family nutrient uptake outer membrane protein [Arcticibacter tournemirensis]|uniref:RagB/SusD family nutrient uptake outer membrane protein n=1 Tax=Arcticibacter tournemirensis TaxID=699437 RepID=A0A4Q0M6U5_9SPHI|nr:RagB/SusD family nutrient uptake outer membrane protein [Arcticibacter tournemirensis]RXF68791.1 RagB/SusD family nutrient uptake outer membrane protein [Arcticibacter tournemirensis]
MKKYLNIYTCLLLLFLTSLGACKKDFLERYPTAKTSPQTFFKTENDLKSYTNYFYTFFPDGAEIYNETADNIVLSSVAREIAGTRLIPASGGGWDWGNLRDINFFITSENVKNYPNAAIRDKYLGLARFFRANFYFEKVKRFGDVPWYNIVIETNDEASLKKPRDPRTLVMDSILADIDFAIAHLNTDKSVERVTKWTALALKSRICLYEGTWRKYHTEFNLAGAERFLSECVSASNELMTSSGYTVYRGTNGPTGRPYQDLFDQLTLDPVAAEVILGRRYSAELNLKHGLQFYLTSRTQGKPGLEKRLVNSYLMRDGSRFTDIANYETMEFYDEVQNRDPRLAQTIRTPGYKRITGNAESGQQLAPSFDATVTGYQLIKWMNDPSLDMSGQSIQDLLLFRYGEVLLNYAEAKAELGTLTQDDIDRSIKLLRDRVGMPNLIIATANSNPDPYQAALYPNVTGVNKGVILEIRRERRVELVMEENFRWDDLMRWKEGHLLADPFRGMYFPGTGFFDLDKNGTNDVEVYAGSKPPSTGVYQIPVSDLSQGTKGLIVTNRNIVKTFNENRDYLWPLPIEDLTMNPNLTQNPYWE